MVTLQRAILTHCQSLGRDYDTLVHAISLSLQLLHCIIRREIEHFKTLLVFIKSTEMLPQKRTARPETLAEVK